MIKEIPIFFTTDDNYIPYLDVAISSLIANASKDYQYRIIILNTGIKQENIDKVKLNQCSGFVIDFVDISKQIENIKSRFKNVYHFSIVTYYRLFIASLFPQYDKIIYLDCDLVVLGDISELYHIELKENILGAVPDYFVATTKEFRAYVENAIGVNPDKYFNAGVLLINLDEFRKNNIENKFVKFISEYDFDLVDPDQAYLNYLCYGKTKLLPNGWNKAPVKDLYQGNKKIIHYNLYKKPWQYDDVVDGSYFWEYAKKSPFYELILKRKADFSEAEKAKHKTMAIDIILHADRVALSRDTFKYNLGAKV